MEPKMVLYLQAFSAATASDNDYIGRTGASHPAAAANIGTGGRGDRGRDAHEARELPSAAAATSFEPNLKRKNIATLEQLIWNHGTDAKLNLA